MNREKEITSPNLAVSPKGCSQLFLTLIFHQVGAFDLIMKLKSIRKSGIGLGFKVKLKACVSAFNVRNLRD